MNNWLLMVNQSFTYHLPIIMGRLWMVCHFRPIAVSRIRPPRRFFSAKSSWALDQLERRNRCQLSRRWAASAVPPCHHGRSAGRSKGWKPRRSQVLSEKSIQICRTTCRNGMKWPYFLSFFFLGTSVFKPLLFRHGSNDDDLGTWEF